MQRKQGLRIRVPAYNKSFTLLWRRTQPEARAVAHSALAGWLVLLEDSDSRIATAKHYMAALIYRKISDVRQFLRPMEMLLSRSKFNSEHFAIPTVLELLADPAFAPLEQWLRQRRVELDELQDTVNQFLSQVRKQSLASDES